MLVIEDFTQKEVVDYTKTFSHVVKMTTVRMISFAIKKHWSTSQLDVNNVFLHGDLHEEVYIQHPPDMVISNPSLVDRLNKFLYGLKQVSSQCYAKLFDFLTTQGNVHSWNDLSLFFRKKGSSVVFLTIYVDDILVTDNDLQ